MKGETRIPLSKIGCYYLVQPLLGDWIVCKCLFVRLLNREKKSLWLNGKKEVILEKDNLKKY